MVDFNDKIVEAVGPPQAVAWFIGRPAKRPIVAPIMWVFAPGVIWPDLPGWEEHGWARQTVGAPPQPYRVKPARGRCSVAFALRCLDARPALGSPEHPVPGREPALAGQIRPAADMNDGKGSSSHSFACRFPTARSSSIVDVSASRQAARQNVAADRLGSKCRIHVRFSLSTMTPNCGKR